jgi:hypothetical protein
MGRFEIDRRGTAAVKSGLPAGHTNTPAVPRFQSRETPLGHWGYQIVPIQDREIEELFGHFHADRVETDVLRACATISVPVKSSQGAAVSNTPMRIGAASFCRWECLRRQSAVATNVLPV